MDHVDPRTSRFEVVGFVLGLLVVTALTLQSQEHGARIQQLELMLQHTETMEYTSTTELSSNSRRLMASASTTADPVTCPQICRWLKGGNGPPGADGRNGTDGKNGTNGVKGDIGLTGATGATGSTGAVGPTGPAGAPGTNATLPTINYTLSDTFTSNRGIFLSAVGVGTKDPAVPLDVVGAIRCSGPFLQPSYTTTNKNAITTPVAGTLVYDNVLGLPSFYNGALWRTSERLVMGQLNYDGSSTYYSRTTSSSTASELVPTYTFSGMSPLALSGTAGRMVYSGTSTIWVRITFSCSVTTATGGFVSQIPFLFELRKNSAAIVGALQQHTITSSGSYEMISFSTIVQMSTNDYISAWVTAASTSNYGLRFYNVDIVAMGTIYV